jgi:hypothetical protein
MLNLTKHKKYIENLSSNQTTINFILDEIRKMSQVDKIKAIVELAFVKNIRGLKYLLPLNKYREQLQIADQIITPIKYTIEAELKEIELGHSTKNVKLLSHHSSINNQKGNEDDPNPTLKTNQQAPKAQASNEVNLLNNFKNWG